MSAIIWDNIGSRNGFAIGHFNPESLHNPLFRGAWLRGDAFSKGYPQFITPGNFISPRLKWWFAQPGSEYSRPGGHQREVPAHGNQFDEYVLVMTNKLSYIDLNDPPALSNLKRGSQVAKLSPWHRGAWRLPAESETATGLTLLFASPPLSSPIITDGPEHELHIVGPETNPDEQIERLLTADHLRPELTAMLIMVFGGSLRCNGFVLGQNYFAYVPSAQQHRRESFNFSSPHNLLAAVLFYNTDD